MPAPALIPHQSGNIAAAARDMENENFFSLDTVVYIARESGSIDIATRVIESLTERFFLLALHPQLGRRRDHGLRSGLSERNNLWRTNRPPAPRRCPVCHEVQTRWPVFDRRDGDRSRFDSAVMTSNPAEITTRD